MYLLREDHDSVTQFTKHIDHSHILMPECQMTRPVSIRQLQADPGIGKLLLLIINLIAKDLIQSEIRAPKQLSCFL